MSNSTVTSLAFLRGFAVLAVTFCHFGEPLARGSVLPDLFEGFAEYGKYGVHIFFVISGFVIPYSLNRAKYSIRNYFQFLYKRLLRLHPPYLVALALTILVASASYHVRHLESPETPFTMLLSLFYAHIPGDNPVFWTLKVEAQYYIFIGLFFPVLRAYKKYSVIIGLPLLILVSQSGIAGYVEFFSYIVFFLIGTVGFLLYQNSNDNLSAKVALVALVVFAYFFHDLVASTVALLTILIILFYRRPVNRIIEHPGLISYSIYLIHFPIGVKLINLSQRYFNPDYHWVLFIVAFTVCYALSWLFSKYIEAPSAILSNRVKYHTATETSNKYIADVHQVSSS